MVEIKAWPLLKNFSNRWRMMTFPPIHLAWKNSSWREKRNNVSNGKNRKKRCKKTTHLPIILENLIQTKNRCQRRQRIALERLWSLHLKELRRIFKRMIQVGENWKTLQLIILLFNRVMKMIRIVQTFGKRVISFIICLTMSKTRYLLVNRKLSIPSFIIS